MEPVQTTAPIKQRSVRAVRTITAFDQRLDLIQHAFADALTEVLEELKDEIKESQNFVLFIVRCMQAVRRIKADLPQYERDQLVVDLVKQVVDAMPITDEEKETIRTECFPTIEGILVVLNAASNGLLYLKQAEAKIKGSCFGKAGKTRDIASSPVVDTEALASDVFNTVQTVIRFRQLTISSIISIGSTVMQIVEQYPQLSGAQKKEVALSVLRRIVDTSNVSDDTRRVLQSVISTTLPMVIDFIVMAARGQIAFVNMVSAQVKGCFHKG
jgi:hypothetical protein